MDRQPLTTTLFQIITGKRNSRYDLMAFYDTG